MRAGFAQYDVIHGDKRGNFAKACTMIKEGCDLYVLPELCFTGYMFDSKYELLCLAETIPGGETERALRELSAARSCSIIAGVAEKEEGKLYNTALIVCRGKYVGKYRKIHLSDYEKLLFERGTQNSVFELEGVRVGVQICFDLWFPEVSRKQVLSGADMLCALANFGGETTPRIARVRAIENQTPLILCNRIGNERCGDIDADFLGNSMIIGPDGEPLCPDSCSDECFSYAEIPPKPTGNVICSDFIKEMGIHYSTEN